VAELSEVKQGLGVTRLIFNTDRSEDGLILEYLRTALQLRELAGDKVKMSDTLNSLGMLKQRQCEYAEAERHYTHSLEVRRALSEGGDKAKTKEKWQLVAQSLVSLGNLFSEIGDSKAAGGVAQQHSLELKPLHPSAEESRSCTLLSKEELYRHALEVLEEARSAYTKGFSPGHPKVAWALEGMAKVHQKVGDLRSAQEAMSGALAIRHSLQRHDTGKHLFTKELQQGERTKVEIEQKRLKLRLGLQAKIRKGVLAKVAFGGGGAGASKGLKEPSEPSVGSPSSLRQPLLAAHPPVC